MSEPCECYVCLAEKLHRDMCGCEAGPYACYGDDWTDGAVLEDKTPR